MFLAGCGKTQSGPPEPPAGAIPAGQSIGTGVIRGRVLLKGQAPKREKIKITESNCLHGQAEDLLTESVVANADGTLRNVLVYVKSGLGSRVFAYPKSAATLDQKGCVYIPHVIGVQANQLVTFVNSDPTLHNVHAVTKINDAFNLALGAPGQKVSRYFPKPEIVKMKCDVHSWMTSYIGVFEHPFFAVTGDAGAFELKGLPPGTYEIEAWQEKLGTSASSVTLAEGETREVEFSLGM
jgi:plastocyanin